MDIVSYFESIPPTFIGIILGSFLTVLGVILTNASNTKRLRLQHEHEQELENKARDLNMRRDIYMEAMEAVSAGLVAVSRFSELNNTPEDLMRTYTDLSPKIGKVIIVAKNETIKAVTTFNSAMTGAFMRLTTKREKLNALFQQSVSLETEIEEAEKTKINFAERIETAKIGDQPEQILHQLMEAYQVADEKVQALTRELESNSEALLSTQMVLVQDSLTEVAQLDLLVVPLIGKMRAELGLPFSEEFYAQILIRGHEELKNYLSTFFSEYDIDNSAEER